MITAEQSRAARGLLGVNLQVLSDLTKVDGAKGISKVSLTSFENGGVMRASNNEMIRKVFEKAGVEFISKSKSHGVGVRLIKPE